MQIPKSCHLEVGAHQCQRKREERKTSGKKEERKGIEAQRVKQPTPSRAIHALIGGEEQKGKRKRTKERKWEWLPNPATLDYSVTSYDAQGSYGEPIHFPLPRSLHCNILPSPPTPFFFLDINPLRSIFVHISAPSFPKWIMKHFPFFNITHWP